MNLAIVVSPNFGSGRITRLGTSRRLGMRSMFRFQSFFILFRLKRIGHKPLFGARIQNRHPKRRPDRRSDLDYLTVRQLFVARGENLLRDFCGALSIRERLYHRDRSAKPVLYGSQTIRVPLGRMSIPFVNY